MAGELDSSVLQIDSSVEMPGWPSRKSSGSVNMDNYAVKYHKADIDDLEQLSMLEEIETEGLQGKNIVVLDKKINSFQDRFFVLLVYLKKKPS